MAKILTTNITLQVAAALSNADAFSNVQYPLNLQQVVALASGTGANKADQLWVSQRTLASGASESIDLFDFADAKDQVGVALANLHVKALIIQNLGLISAATPTETDSLTIGNNATSGEWQSFINSVHGTVLIPGGGTLIAIAPGAVGYAITDLTNNLLKVLNNSGANTVTYNIIVIGASA